MPIVVVFSVLSKNACQFRPDFFCRCRWHICGASRFVQLHLNKQTRRNWKIVSDAKIKIKVNNPFTTRLFFHQGCYYTWKNVEANCYADSWWRRQDGGLIIPDCSQLLSCSRAKFLLTNENGNCNGKKACKKIMA